MRLLKTAFHPEVSPADIQEGSGLKLLTRNTARAIILRGSDILLLYTARYDDYSLPGGGIDPGEDNITGLKRELEEETGAHGTRNIVEFGRYEEYRLWYKSDADILHIVSFCYRCDIDEELGETSYEDYEVKNGMKALWINIDAAIEHNEKVIDGSPKKGLSIQRETFLLKKIVESLK